MTDLSLIAERVVTTLRALLPRSLLGPHGQLWTEVPSKQASKVTLARCKPFHINVSEPIIIGPSVQATDRFSASLSIKDAVLKALDPVKLKLRVKRMSFGPKNIFVLQSENIGATAIANCTSFIDAGIKIKPDVKIIIHDVLVNISANEILSRIKGQSLSTALINNLKAVHSLPRNDKKYQSGIFETELAH